MRLKLTTLAVLLATAAMPSHSEDLLEAYQQARANDPTLSQADAQRRSVGEDVPQARALLLPQISASLGLQQQSGSDNSSSSSSVIGTGNDFLCTGLTAGTGTYACSQYAAGGGNSDLGHVRSRNLSAQLSQVIFNLADIANLRAAHSTADAQEKIYDAAAQDLYVRVAAAYLSVLTDEELLRSAKASEDSFKQAYDQATAQFKAGTIAITDQYSAKASYEQAKAQRLTDESTLNDARESLTQITGQPVGELKKLRDDLPLTPPEPNDIDAWVKTTLQNSPTLQADQQTVESAEHTINAARAGHLPTIDATVSRGKTSTWYENGSSNYAGNGRYGTTIGVTLTVPIFSGGATQSKVRQAIDNRDSAQDSLEIDRRQAIRNTLNFFRLVIAGISEVESSKAAVESAQKSLDGTRAQYNVGTKTMTDVLLAIQTLAQAQSSYAQSRHQLVLDQLQLKQSAGTIGMQDLQAINSQLE